MPQSQQHGIQDRSVTYTTAHGNAGYLTHWARPGIESASSWILVRFITTKPEQELPRWLFKQLRRIASFQEWLWMKLTCLWWAFPYSLTYSFIKHSLNDCSVQGALCKMISSQSLSYLYRQTPGDLVKTRCWFSGSGRGPRFCIPNETPGLPLLLLHRHILGREGLGCILDNICLPTCWSFQLIEINIKSAILH